MVWKVLPCLCPELNDRYKVIEVIKINYEFTKRSFIQVVNPLYLNEFSHLDEKTEGT
jgi:hypothetical protein